MTVVDVLVLAVVAIEASRAGAVVVGEDLGTVEPEVTEGLAEHGMLGCAVLWFQRSADGALLPPRQWHPDTLASVSTHDLPTAAGFLTDEHVRALRAALVEDERRCRDLQRRYDAAPKLGAAPPVDEFEDLGL